MQVCGYTRLSIAWTTCSEVAAALGVVAVVGVLGTAVNGVDDILLRLFAAKLSLKWRPLVLTTMKRLCFLLWIALSSMTCSRCASQA